MTKVNILLEGLGCAHCASKIEDRIKKNLGLQNAILDFSQSKLYFEFDEVSSSKETLISEVKKIVHELEPDVVVKIQGSASDKSHEENHDHNHSQGSSIRLLLSLLLFFSSFFISTPIIVLALAYIISGHKVLYKSFRNILKGQIFDENFLMSIATIGAIALGEYHEAVAVMIFYDIGMFFEDRAINHSRSSIKALINIRPDQALLLKNEAVKVVSPEDLSIGDKILVKPGMRIPIDGFITEGEAMIDSSMLTGESIPLLYKKGDKVLSGAVVLNSVITIEVEKLFGDSTVSRILELVENASGQKSKTEHFITKFAKIYTPIVVLSAITIAFLPPILITGATFDDWIYRSLIFLVISCPCALVVSVPLGFFSGIGSASKNGILIKGSNYLEALNKIDTFVFDKTGTLTMGRFSVYSWNTDDEKRLMQIAYMCEKDSTHPIAKSITEFIERLPYYDSLDILKPNKIEEISGMGIKITSENRVYLAGNRKLCEEHGLYPKAIDSLGTTVYIYEDNIYVGSISLKDNLRNDSQKTIEALKALGKEIWMLTGDRNAEAEFVARELGIEHFKAELLPKDKYDHISLLKSEGKQIAFIGDGINDAPVLALSDVGISMGNIGSDAAIEASDIVFMTDEPHKIISTLSIAKITHRIVTQNIIFSLLIKFLIMGFGVIGLSTMWMAIFGDVGVTLIAVLNSTRIVKLTSK